LKVIKAIIIIFPEWPNNFFVSTIHPRNLAEFRYFPHDEFINQNRAKRDFKRNARSTIFVLRRQLQFFEKVISPGESIAGGFGRFLLLLNSLKKIGLFTHFTHFLSTGVVIASSRALQRVLLNKEI